MSYAFLLIHGKNDGPNAPGTALWTLIKFLKDREIETVFNEYSWSHGLRYSGTVKDAIEEIHEHYLELQEKHDTVHILGHSLGANILLQYIKKYKQPNGSVILVNPAHNTGDKHFIRKCIDSINQAYKMVKQGRTLERYPFVDVNKGQTEIVECLPIPYLDMMSCYGLNNMYLLDRKDFDDQPLLVLSSKGDATQVLIDELWEEIGRNENSRLVKVNSDKHKITYEHLWTLTGILSI